MILFEDLHILRLLLDMIVLFRLHLYLNSSYFKEILRKKGSDVNENSYISKYSSIKICF